MAMRLDFAIGEFGVRHEKVRRALVKYLVDDRAEGFTDPVSIQELPVQD
jgi:hypothetical protein